MVVVVIDGPEKAGKSTLVESLRASVKVNFQETRVRKWGRLDDGRWAVDQVYAEALTEDTEYEGLVIWDRSWASEAVYAKLIGRNRRLGDDPWLGEWLYGRGVQLKFILGGPHPSVMTGQLDEDDRAEGHGQDMAREQQAFVEYGTKYGWHVIGHTDRERLPLDTLVRLVGTRIGGILGTANKPREYCGPSGTSVVFIGERGSNNGNMPGGWLPFSSAYTTNYGRILGDAALRVGWTNAYNDRQNIFDHAHLVIACGRMAYEWAKGVNSRVKGGTKVVRVYHPAALYRWGNLREKVGPTEAYIRELVGQYIPLT